jgi:Mlc titration factor MtfA (ptsG expression regulator)
MDFLKSWRKSTAAAPPGLDEALWTRVTAGLPFLRGLSDNELSKLRELAVAFLDEKEMAGAGGLELSNEMRLSIALQACLPVLNLGLEGYRGWVGIVVYPDGFVVEREDVDENGVVHTYQEEISGEAWSGGPVVLSWRDASTGSYSGYNVVIHEFAHKLDMLNGEDEEFPRARPGMDRAAWRQVFEAAFDRFVRQVDDGEPTFIDPYAAEHPREFFAVMSEAFFTASAVLARDWPELYAQLAAYYRQDPAGVLDAGA